MNGHKGILGTVTTSVSAIAAWLPAINEIVQIVAGLVAIVVGIATIIHYHKKDKNL